MRTLLADIRYALRQLRRSPAFVLTVIATLAIGIGLNAAIFTVVDCVILRPLGYHDANRILALETRFLDEGRSIPRLGDGDYSDLSRGVKGLEATAYYWGGLYGVELAGNALYLNAALTTIASVPDVASVTAADGAPMASKLTDVDYAVRGRQVFAPGVQHLPNADVNAISSSFFHTLQIPLLRGREFSPADRSGAPPVLLISRSLAQEVFPHEDPLGRQIMCGLEETSRWWTIVGVVGDVRDRSPAAAPRPTMYVPIAQHLARATDMQFVVRSRGNAAAMVDILRRQLKHADPGIAIEGTSMHANIAGTEQADRFRTVLFASFAGVSILLAGVGLYGVTAYTVAQRRFEFGVRLALGASPGQMLRLVLRNAAKITGVGIAIGVALSLAATRVLDSVVGKLPGFDGPAFFFAALGVLLLALLAAFLPARAAAAVNPVEVLRAD